MFAAGTLLAVLVFPVAAADVQRELAAESNRAFEAATIKPPAPDACTQSCRAERPESSANPQHDLDVAGVHRIRQWRAQYRHARRGGPDWVDKKPFAVEGVAAGRATPEQRWRMLQTLLEERFALKLRRNPGSEMG